MTVVTMQQAKAELRIVLEDTEQDDHIQLLLDASEAEAAAFCNRENLPNEPSVASAVLLLLRSKFDLEDARDMARYRSVAETLLTPYRIDMGI